MEERGAGREGGLPVSAPQLLACASPIPYPPRCLYCNRGSCNKWGPSPSDSPEIKISKATQDGHYSVLNDWVSEISWAPVKSGEDGFYSLITIAIAEKPSVTGAQLLWHRRQSLFKYWGVLKERCWRALRGCSMGWGPLSWLIGTYPQKSKLLISCGRWYNGARWAKVPTKSCPWTSGIQRQGVKVLPRDASFQRDFSQDLEVPILGVRRVSSQSSA